MNLFVRSHKNLHNKSNDLVNICGVCWQDCLQGITVKRNQSDTDGEQLQTKQEANDWGRSSTKSLAAYVGIGTQSWVGKNEMGQNLGTKRLENIYAGHNS